MKIPVDIDDSYDTSCSESERNNWRHNIYLFADKDEPYVGVITQYGNGTPEPAYHNRWVRLGRITTGITDTSPLYSYLEGDAAQAMLARVYAGHTVEWNGSNHVGRLDDDAGAARDALDCAIENLILDLPYTEE